MRRNDNMYILRIYTALCWVYIMLLTKGICTDAINFTMGFLTGSQRRPWNREYTRHGLIISGAISLAVDEINQNHSLVDNHLLTFTVAETFGEETESIRQTAMLWTERTAVYIGPQETCIHEARMASSFNLPMISYVSFLFLILICLIVIHIFYLIIYIFLF